MYHVIIVRHSLCFTKVVFAHFSLLLSTMLVFYLMEWDQVVYGTIHNVWPILGAQSRVLTFMSGQVFTCTWCNVKKRGDTIEIEQYVQNEYEIMLYIVLQK